ncbi:DUF1992 domain-containing protein [Dictyobacter arantiisoli]|uniref:DnaJ family domain-containing protein n=1 Tax=Dictyobacter arantiisoli TaxID=2014874 RepID=UPI001F2917A0|nr:DUF1992 domain-containing protein [Dictyobacter arantiisoli]
MDWRKRTDKPSLQAEEKRQAAAFRGRRMGDYVEELIRAAQERGEFDHLAGAGKPLNLEQYQEWDEFSMAHHLLKGSGYVPAEIELQRQIDRELAEAQEKLQRILAWRQRLLNRRFVLIDHQKRAYLTALDLAAVEYDDVLRRINKRILTLNLSTPAPMHRPIIKVDELVTQFREEAAL